jgi:hypothetical protein
VFSARGVACVCTRRCLFVHEALLVCARGVACVCTRSRSNVQFVNLATAADRGGRAATATLVPKVVSPSVG